jgi:hypothetical protein
MRKLFRKVLWLGRGTATAMGIAVMLALVLGAATTALAAVPGDPFKLGRQNTIDALSRMVGTVNDAMLRIDNDSAGASATALELRVEPGQPPMKVDSSTKVTALNADQVDGKSAGAFLGADEKAAGAVHADQADDAANANELDGLDSGVFSRAVHRHDDRYYTEGEADARYVSKSNHTKAAHDALNINADEVDGKSADEISVNYYEGFVSGDSGSFSSDSPQEATATCPGIGQVIVGTGFAIDGGTSGTSPNEETNVVVNEIRPLLDRVTVEAYEEAPTSDTWRVTAYAVCARYGSSAP